MRRVHWGPEAAVRAMHAELIAEHGGREGLRDAGLLSSALARPRNKRAYGVSSSIFDLAAAYGVAIVRNHPFVDGNKRVALAVMYVFLERNGYRLEASEVDAVETMLSLAATKRDEKELSAWLKENSVRLSTKPADYLGERAKHGRRGKFERATAKVRDVEPEKKDAP